MKLSIEHHVLRKHFGDEQAIRMIAQAGFDAMDFSFYWMGEASILNREDRIDYARRLRAVADECHLSITQAHAPFDLSLTAPIEKQACDYEQIVRSIEFSGILGVRQIIVHNIAAPDPADFIKTNLEFFRSLEQPARAAGVRIAVENLWGFENGKIVGGRLSTPAELSAFLDQLNPEYFCGCIDLGHAAIIGEDPAGFIRALNTPKLQALHVQDTDLMRDTHTLPFLARHDWPSICRALADVRYEGDLTFEIFGFLGALPREALPAALKLAHDVGRRLIADIQAC